MKLLFVIIVHMRTHPLQVQVNAWLCMCTGVGLARGGGDHATEFSGRNLARSGVWLEQKIVRTRTTRWVIATQQMSIPQIYLECTIRTHAWPWQTVDDLIKLFMLDVYDALCCSRSTFERSDFLNRCNDRRLPSVACAGTRTGNVAAFAVQSSPAAVDNAIPVIGVRKQSLDVNAAVKWNCR